MNKKSRFFRGTAPLLCFLFVITNLPLIGQSFTGYAVSEVSLDSIEYTECFGFSDKEEAIPYNTATVQNVGSVSKTLIGLSLMIAHEQGLVDLDRDINDYLDFEVQNPHIREKNIITLRHLATHTSGITDNPKYYRQAYSKGDRPEMDLGKYLREYLTSAGSKFSNKNYSKTRAGVGYAYSNIGAALAAYVLEKTSGMPFGDFTKKYILMPLGMNSSGWSYAEINRDNHATLYDKHDKPLAAYTLITYPDGGFRTTINDLSLYLKELMNGYNHMSNLLTDGSWDELFRKNFTPENPVKGIHPGEPNSGIFFAWSKSGLVGHTGSDPGASSVMWFDPKLNRGWIFIANEDMTERNVEEFKKIWNRLK